MQVYLSTLPQLCPLLDNVAMNLSGSPQQIREMLALRASGLTINALALLFEMDRTSIRHHLLKYNIRPLTTEVRFKIAKKEKPVQVWPTANKYEYLFDEPINKGHTYREYLALAQQRNPKEEWHKIPLGNGRTSDISVELGS